jgi:hypothetical protein
VKECEGDGCERRLFLVRVPGLAALLGLSAAELRRRLSEAGLTAVVRPTQRMERLGRTWSGYADRASPREEPDAAPVSLDCPWDLDFSTAEFKISSRARDCSDKSDRRLSHSLVDPLPLFIIFRRVGLGVVISDS